MGTQHALGMHTGSHTVFGPRHALQSARRHAWKLAPRCSRLGRSKSTGNRICLHPEHVKLLTSAIFFFLPLHWYDAIPAGGSSHHVKRDQPHSDKTCDLCARQAT